MNIQIRHKTIAALTPVAVAHFESGDRVANLDRFEFNAGDGKPGVSNVVYRGTGRRAAPADIRLNSDLPNP